MKSFEAKIEYQEARGWLLVRNLLIQNRNNPLLLVSYDALVKGDYYKVVNYKKQEIERPRLIRSKKFEEEHFNEDSKVVYY